MTVSKNTRMLQILNYRLKVTLKDGRTFTGQLLAFDRHMNLVIADCEEYRKFKSKKTKEEIEEKRVLGLVILRGEHVVSLNVVAPPPAGEGPRRMAGSQKMAVANAGMGMMQFPMPGAVGRPMGRGMPPGMGASVASSAPVGLAGPVAGVGPMGVPPPGFVPPGAPGMRPPFPPPPPGILFL